VVSPHPRKATPIQEPSNVKATSLSFDRMRRRVTRSLDRFQTGVFAMAQPRPPARRGMEA
jgi:hypothetical protein